MKLNKIMLVSLILLTILSIGAASAQDSDNILSADDSAGSIKEIYVSDTGEDTGSGSQASPYATLNKSISEVNSSDNAVIHVGPGTYSGESNTNLQINLAHRNYNGSLTFIGDSNGGTIFDGDDSAPIFKSISADSIVTFINITFTHGRTDMGSAIRSSGDLTIDNCVFEENYVTNLGAIYSEKGNLTIKNSKFYKNSGYQYVDLYFSHEGLVTLINNIFESGTATSSSANTPAVFVGTGKSVIKGNTFKNLTSSHSAAALAVRYNNGDNIANITDNTFINCTYTGSNGGIVFFQNSYLKGNKFIDCTSTTATLYSVSDFNAKVAFEDVEIDGTQFVLKANVTDDGDNTVQSAKVVFTIDGKTVGTATSEANGVASLTVNKLLENGEYTISGTQAYSDVNPFEVTVVDGKATVNFDHSPAEVWVSTEGNDTTGDGSEANPFLTLKKALDYGTATSVDLIVHIKDGLYNGSENRDLSYSNVGKITILGESYGNVIIDAEHAKSGTGWLASGSNIFTFGQNLEIKLVNLTFINCDGNPVDAYALTMNDNIVINSSTVRAQAPNDGVFIDNLKVINGSGQAINAYNLVLTNSLFENCDGKTSTGLLWLATRDDNVIHLENNTFIGNTIGGYSGGAAYYNQGDLVSINNTFDSNTVTGSASNIAYASGNQITSINDKFINNNVTSYVAQYRSSGNDPEIIVENITFINNRASANGAGLVTTGAKIKGAKFINNTAAGNGGAIYLLNHGKTSPVCEMSIEDVTFKDNTAACGNDIFIAPSAGSNVFANLTDLTITANSQNVTELSDFITVTVSHPSGAIIGGGQVTFYFGGDVIGKSDLINQNATLEYVGFKNNTKYQFTSVYEYATENDTYISGVVSTNIADAVDSIELYVSNSTGSDENGNGSQNNPFKSISKALSEGYTKSTNITVHVLEGNYTGELNTNLRIPTTVDVTIVGEDADKVIVTDSAADYFITALTGNAKLTLANVTLNRAARDTQSAIYVEEGANVEIDNVKFIGGQGNYGGAINTAGTLVVNNSYFFDNGYGDVSKKANAYYGGAICNDGILIIDNSTFEANHAGRLSTIANQGTLYMNNSKVTDSLNAYSMNMDLVAIGAFGGQKGNITIENSIFTVTNRTVDELSNRIYMPQNSLTCLAIGSSEHVTIINSTFEDKGGRYTPNAFGGINSWNLAMGGYTLVPGDVEVYNSTFRNLQSVSLFYTRTDGSSYHSHRLFDGCLFENVEYLIAALNSGDNLSVAIHNSVILSDNITKIGIAAGKTIDMDISDNWWGSNNATYKNATITTSNFIGNYVLKLKETSSEVVNPENFLVLTLNATNKTGLLQDVTLAFKSTDGENVTDYEGSLYPRDFVMSATNGTLADENGTIDNAVVNAFEGTEGQGYYIEATVDNQTVNLTVEDKLAIGNVTILAEDVIITYGETQINVTVLEESGIVVAEGVITLKLNNETYTADIINGTATFDIDVLPNGVYTLEYSINMDNVYNPASNSSNLTVVAFKTNITANASDIKVGEDAIITVTVDSDATGTITVNNETKEVKNGAATFTISDLGEGNYTYEVTYSGDDKYTKETAEVKFEVSKVSDYEFEASADDIKVGQDAIIEVTLPRDATGNVSINGKSAKVENGSAKFVISGLGEGNYTYEVTYSGDDKYTANTTEVSFAVSKISEFEINASANDVILGNDVIVTVSGIPDDAKGIVTVKVNGKDYESIVSKGTASVSIPKLENGKYNADVTYSGDEKYANKSTTVSFEVSNIVTNDTFEKFFDEKGNLRDEVKCDELIFDGVISNKNTDKININRPMKLLGENATLNNIAINITSDDVCVDGFTIEADNITSAIIVDNASDVDIVNNVLNVVGETDKDAYAILANKADNLNISGNTVNYEGNTNGTALNNAVLISESKDVVVNDNVFNITVPSSYVPWAEVPAGSGNWVSSPVSEGLVFDNCDNLELSENDIAVNYNNVVGSYDTIYAVDIKNSDNAKVKSNTIDAKGHTYIYGLIVSGENFTISDNNITSESDSYYANGIDVEGPASGIIKDNNIVANAPLSAYPVYSAMSNGNVEVEHKNNNISGKAAVIYGMELGGAKETVTGNNINLEGNYTIGIASRAKELDVKDNTIVSAGSNVGSPSVWESIPYETTGIKAIAGKVNVENNNITTTGNNSIVLTTNDDVNVVGNYLVADELTGDASVSYVPGNATVKDNVPAMKKVNVTASDVEAVYGENVKVNATVTDYEGNPVSDIPVSLTVGNKTYTAKTDKNGIASFDLGKLDAGNYTLEYSIDEDGYSKESVDADASINQTDADIAIDINKPVKGEDLIVNVTAPADAKGNITVSVNGKDYTVPIKDGKATISIPNLGDGNYTVDVKYSGDNNYEPVEKSLNATVEKAIIVSAPDVTKYFKGSERFVVTVTDNKGTYLSNKTVVIVINGVTYTKTTNVNGTTSIALGLNSGVYNVTVTVDNETSNAVVTILSTVNGTDVVKVYRNGTQYYATFRDSEGNYLKEGTVVKFNINGVMYERKISGSEGLAKLNLNLGQGTYVLTAMNPVTRENAANNITIISRLIENSDITKYYKNATQYTVKVIGDDGNPVGAGETVTFNINGVMYNRQTNASGIAKLNLNLPAGDYIITGEYKNCKVSNKIKILPVLSAKDISMKYRDGSKFVATLVDGQGKPFAGQTVQFNVNGVFYNRVTDSSGQAKLNINLMAGKYIITSSYNGANIANTITISA
ncbi:Ig-like domain repeat protein [Methanobrevibacter millerae]|uniref:Adhesin-like protein n=1 Tax=Methanobrevibacter millerae TaxID=230361 RepID=A0A0U2TTF0_9EURY|nr:Ig-like domain repeat protein [Methanobrevibacter millerae]ALT69139.1 adhesin-like protein [Methanobrevibacter millerae]